MAKPKTEDAPAPDTQTAVAVIDAPSTAIATTPRDTRGKDNIGTQDILFPQIKLAQKTSPQLDPGKSEYIDGLKLFQMFNSLTGQNYGNGPLDVTILRVSKRAMEFDANMKVIDFDVPLDDDRLKFTDHPDGTSTKPKATLFYDYLVQLPEGDLAVLSLKTTQIKTAKTINSLLMLTNGPSWMRKCTLTSASKPFGQFTAATLIVRLGPATTAEERAEAEMWYEATANFAEKVDRREATEKADDDIPF
jgi:hypothetical protein